MENRPFSNIKVERFTVLLYFFEHCFIRSSQSMLQSDKRRRLGFGGDCVYKTGFSAQDRNYIGNGLARICLVMRWYHGKEPAGVG